MLDFCHELTALLYAMRAEPLDSKCLTNSLIEVIIIR